MKKLDFIVEKLIFIVLILMTLITFGNVFSRYVLHASWSFVEEITTNLFVWASFLGASVAVKRKGHLGFSAIVDLFPPKMRKAAAIFAVVSAVIVFILLFLYGLEMVFSQYMMEQTSPALGWPEWVFGISIPVGALLMIVRFVELGYLELKGELK